MKKLLVLLTLLSVAGAAQAKENHAIDELDIDIVSDRGRAFASYPLRNSGGATMRAYLEAIPQANYSIRVRNRSPQRIGIVIAVDGRNIISGKKSDLRPAERMYILGPYESASYSGWRTSQNRINRFYFTDSEDSYSAAFGDYSAMGVIAVAAFHEKHRYEPPQTWNKRDDMYERRPGGKRQPAPRAQKEGSLADSEPGTGYGNEEWSPSRRVKFAAERQAFARYFLKYEWRETLCEKGITRCYARNRFWDDRWADRGFAPPPPVRRTWRSRRHW